MPSTQLPGPLLPHQWSGGDLEQRRVSDDRGGAIRTAGGESLSKIFLTDSSLTSYLEFLFKEVVIFTRIQP
jgi:hypothetical protein